MRTTDHAIRRRTFIQLASAAGVSLTLPLSASRAAGPMAKRRIPGTEEALPVVGLGTSDEFEQLPEDGGAQLKAVLATLVEHGGALIDTAPRYGDAERILGEFTRELGLADRLFVSTKIAELGREAGQRSLERSSERLPIEPLDLVMVHSLRDVDTQLDNLTEWQREGRIRYIGVTTSNSNDFERMEALIRGRDLDFVQLNYSPFEPAAAERVIPAAAERGVAVMVNRAFGNGSYFRRVGDRSLPAWAAEFDCDSWAQLSLKYILGNPDVTCVLAATSNPRHMADNAAAGVGALPDPAARRRIEALLASL